MTLSGKHIEFIRLINRSPDTGDRWRKVSKALNAFAHNVANEHPELYETHQEEDVLYVRLSERGQILGDYL